MAPPQALQPAPGGYPSRPLLATAKFTNLPRSHTKSSILVMRDTRISALRASSPGNRLVFPSREPTCRAVRAEQRDAHRLTSARFDGLRAGIAVQICLGETRRDGIDLDPLRLQLERHGDRQSVERRLGRRVNG